MVAPAKAGAYIPRSWMGPRFRGDDDDDAYDIFIAPFAEFEFMRRALVGVFALAIGAGPIGVFLMLRRMSLVGDAMAHAVLPGAAVGFLISGLNIYAMTLGGWSRALSLRCWRVSSQARPN